MLASRNPEKSERNNAQVKHVHDRGFWRLEEHS